MHSATKIYKALGNEARLSIVQELARRNHEVHGTHIVSSCSVALDLAQPTISQHFSRLVACGLLRERKQGTEKYYTLNLQALDVAGIDINKWRQNNGA